MPTGSIHDRLTHTRIMSMTPSCPPDLRQQRAVWHLEGGHRSEVRRQIAGSVPR